MRAPLNEQTFRQKTTLSRVFSGTICCTSLKNDAPSPARSTRGGVKFCCTIGEIRFFSPQATRNPFVKKQLQNPPVHQQPCCKPWQWGNGSHGRSAGGTFVNSYYLSDPGMYAKHAEKVVQDERSINLDEADQVRIIIMITFYRSSPGQRRGITRFYAITHVFACEQFSVVNKECNDRSSDTRYKQLIYLLCILCMYWA